eukprot:2942695-Pyramimonas_sp.AAC.1
MAGDGVDKLTAPQFPFRQRHQAREVVYILRSLVGKFFEWELPLFALGGGLLKPRDDAKHSTLLACLDAKGASRILSAARLRESRRSGASSLAARGDPARSGRVAPQPQFCATWR